MTIETSSPVRSARDERGIALVVTLLLLGALSSLVGTEAGRDLLARVGHNAVALRDLQLQFSRLKQDLLQAHPDLDALYCCNDPSALGARAALEAAGKADKIKIIGFDGQPEGKKAIRIVQLPIDRRLEGRSSKLGMLWSAHELGVHLRGAEPCARLSPADSGRWFDRPSLEEPGAIARDGLDRGRYFECA